MIKSRNSESTKVFRLGKISISTWLIYLISLITIVSIAGFLNVTTTVNADEVVLNPRIEIAPFEGTSGTDVFVRIFDFVPSRIVFVKLYLPTVITINVTTDTVGFAVATIKTDLAPAGQYIISADDGTNIITAYFKVLPTVKLNESGGYVGDLVTIQGNGFAAKKPISIYFDASKVTTSDTDDLGSFANAKFVIPQTTLGKHNIKTQDSEGNVIIQAYNINNKVIIDPLKGCVGDTINIYGSGFPGAISVVLYFDDKDIASVQTDAAGIFATKIIIPPCGDAAHKIKISDGLNPTFNDVTVMPAMTISQKEGFIGMSVSLSGTGFRIGNALNATYDTNKLNGSTVDQNGNFTFSFNIPKSKAGEHIVTVTDGVNTKTAKFSVESTPPLAPNLVLPAEGGRLTKDIRFQWEAVTDPSGVVYFLEISDDTRFTEPLISQSNLNQTYFNVPDNQKILPGKTEPYYWRVKAVDEASNVSQWSVIGTFYKGYTVGTIMSGMPGWTKFALIGLGLILFVFLIIFIWRSIRKVRYIDESYDDEYSDMDNDTEWEQNANTDKYLN